MANEIGLTQLAGSIPDIVRATALEARYTDAVIMNKVMNVDGEVAKKGDRLSLSIMPTLSVNSVGSGGSVTNQQVSLTAVELEINQHKECTVEIEDIAVRQTALSILKEFSRNMGRALAEDQDETLAEEHSNMTTNTAVGDATNPEPLNDDMVRLARLRLDKQKVPKRDRMWFLSPDAEQDLLGAARFTEAQNTGFARGLQVDGGRISKLYGDDVYVSNEIVQSTNAMKNLYVHKEGLGIGTQKNFTLTTLAKTQLSERICGSVLYGTKTVRGNHCVVVNSSVNSGS